MPPSLLADYPGSAGFPILDNTRHQAVASVEPEPTTRDPFDRLLLAQCLVDGSRLVTFDRALAVHPLAYTGAPAA